MLRRILARGGATVIYRLDGTDLRLPIDHALPLYRLAHPGYSANIGKIAALVQRRYPDMRMIDIGSNVGDTVAIVFGQTRLPILCIEGDPLFANLLRRNMKPFGELVRIHEGLVGDRNAALPGSLTRRAGTASITDTPDPARTVTFETLETILDRHPDFKDFRLIKIDTDGFDTLIIKGTMRIWEKVCPVIFFEYERISRQGSDAGVVLASLVERGYTGLAAYDNTGRFLDTLALDSQTPQQLSSIVARLPPEGYLDLCLFHGKDAVLLQSLADSGDVPLHE